MTHDEKYKDEFRAIAYHSNEKIHAGKLSFCSPSAFSQDNLIYLSKLLNLVGLNTTQTFHLLDHIQESLFVLGTIF